MDNKSIFKNSVYSVIYNLANVLLPLIISIYVSRVLKAEGIGIVAFATTFVSYFVTLSALGLPSYGTSAISKAKRSQKEKNKVFSELFVINAISTTISLISYLCIILFVDSLRSNLLLYMCCGIQLILCYFNIDWLYKGEEEYAYITKRNIFIKVLSILFIIIFVRNSKDYIIYALISSAAMGLNYVFDIIYLKKFVKFSMKNLNLRIHMKPLAFLAISLFFSSIYSKVDITMLGATIGNKSVGYYSNGHKIINIIITTCTSITAVFLPRMSLLYKENKEKFIRLLNNGIRIILFISIPATIGVFLLSNPAIMVLYGSSFAKTGTVLMIFSPLIIIKGLGDLLCYQTVISIGKEKYLIPAAFAAMIINVVLNIVLIPIYYEIGATIASVISEFVVNAIMIILIRRNVKFMVSFTEVLKVIISSIVMGCSVLIIMTMNFSNILTCILSTIVGGVVFILSNLMLKNVLLFDIYKLVLSKKKEK